MSDKKTAVSFEGNMSREQVLDYLQGLAAGAREGTLHIERDEQELVLQLAEVVELAVKIRAKKGKRSLRFELSWGD